MSYRKARTEHDRIKLMTYMQYIQQCWRERKENHNKKKVMCVNCTTAVERLFGCRNSYSLRLIIAYVGRQSFGAVAVIPKTICSTLNYYDLLSSLRALLSVHQHIPLQVRHLPSPN